MNKLIIGNDYDAEMLVIQEDTDMLVKFSNASKKINIIVENDLVLNIMELSFNTQNTISIVLKENSRVIYNRAIKDVDDIINISMDGKASSVEMNISAINNTKTKCVLDIIHNNVETVSKLSNHGINLSTGELVFYVNSQIKSCGQKSITNQENRIMNTNCGKSNIFPNLIVDNNDIEANHSAYISDFDKESLFYLKSRGISEHVARELLTNGFLIGNLTNKEIYEQELINFFK